MEIKIYKQLKHLCLFVVFAFGGISTLQAQYFSSEGWVFDVKDDGTAFLNWPYYENWQMSDWYDCGTVNTFCGTSYQISSSLSLPSTVTKITFIEKRIECQDNLSYAYGDTYTVTETGASLSAEQRAALTSVFIPNTITIISANAFSNCNIPSITIPSSVTTIGTSAFSKSSLVSITIPESVTSMSAAVFTSCTSLQSATILNSAIGNNQFLNCTALKDVTLSNNVTTIGGGALANCTSVETLTIPASVTSVYGSTSFSGMTGLKTLNFYAKTVPQGCFSGLPIENLDLTGVETIAAYPFQYCTKLKTAVLSESLKTIGGSAFSYDSSLISITIPESVTSMGGSVFTSCTSLQSATILNSAIGNNQFLNCTALKDVTLSNNVTTIGGGAFANCTALQTVTVGWATPLSVPTNIFSGMNTKVATLYVPAGTKALYQAAPVWKDFGSIVEMDLVVPNDTLPIGEDGKGNIELNLSIPGNATLTGSFEIHFPDGMALNEELTVLSPELSSNFSLAFTNEGNNTWLIEIKSNGLKSLTASEFTKIMDIAFIVNDNVANGNYEATITNLDFLLDNNTSIKQDLITAPINVERVATSIENIGNTSFYACFINNTLKIESAYTGMITIYSTLGIQLYSVKKDAGTIEMPFTSLPGSVFIVKGSISGTTKVVK